MIQWSSHLNGTLPAWKDHVATVNGKKVAVISEGCFSRDITFYDPKTGERVSHDYEMNRVSIPDIKTKVEQQLAGSA